MEDHDPTLKNDLTPPSTGRASIIMNGAGNGMMLGGIPAITIEAYKKVTSNRLPKSLEFFEKNAMLGAIVGCVAGIGFGIKEARELKEYREALQNELRYLHGRVDATHERMNSWADKENIRQHTDLSEKAR